MSIRVRGPWMWAWGANILMLWGLVFLSATLEVWGVDRKWLLSATLVWCQWFIVQECIGWWKNNRDKGPELARTFSQVMQYFATKDKGSSFWQTLTGWDLFVTMHCIMAGYIPGYAVGAFWGAAAGWLVGLTIGGWNYGHWHNRRKHG